MWFCGPEQSLILFYAIHRNREKNMLEDRLVKCKEVCKCNAVLCDAALGCQALLFHSVPWLHRLCTTREAPPSACLLVQNIQHFWWRVECPIRSGRALELFQHPRWSAGNYHGIDTAHARVRRWNMAPFTLHSATRVSSEINMMVVYLVALSSRGCTPNIQ